MTSNSPSSISAVEEEGTAWVIRLTSGAFTYDDAEELRRWRAQDPAHEDAFVDAVRFQRKIRDLLRRR